MKSDEEKILDLQRKMRKKSDELNRMRMQLRKFGAKATDIELCIICDTRATWVRETQFSGRQYYCDADARKEKDFGKNYDSYFFWRELPR